MLINIFNKYNQIKFPIRSIINLNSNNLKYYSVNNYKNQHRKQGNHQNNSRDDDHHNQKQQYYNYENFFFKFGTTGIGLGLFGLFYINWDTFNYILFPKISAATVTNKPLENRTKFNFIADAVELTAPAVVYIEIKDTRRYDYHSGKPFTASNGSGFIVQSDGLILTNAHVVINKPHTLVQVRLLDGRTFPGTVEDIDSESDLATVRVKCNNLPTVKLGESSSLRAGEWVIALGSPLALSNTVTSGVISSTQRPSQELGLKGRNINYIQIDVPITFGNSGGPLVNLDGEAIGVNSMKVTAGISFAIPIDYAKEFLKKASDRRAKGGGKSVLTSPTRRYMGITMLTLTDDIFRELQQRNHTVPDNVRYGVLVWKVIIGSPAHIGGLNPGDIITHINGKEVRNSSDIFNALGETGKTLNLTVYRGLQKISVTVQPEDD